MASFAKCLWRVDENVKRLFARVNIFECSRKDYFTKTPFSCYFIFDIMIVYFLRRRCYDSFPDFLFFGHLELSLNWTELKFGSTNKSAIIDIIEGSRFASIWTNWWMNEWMCLWLFFLLCSCYDNFSQLNIQKKTYTSKKPSNLNSIWDNLKYFFYIMSFQETLKNGCSWCKPRK